MSTTTANMALTLPTPGVDPGTGWATSLNSGLSLVDAHDHSPGKGVRIGAPGLNIQSDLTLNGYSLLGASGVQLATRPGLNTTQSTLLYCLNGNLVYSPYAGTNISLTSGPSVVSGNQAMTYGTSGLISSATALTGTEQWAIGRVDTTAARAITLPLASSAPGRFYLFEDATGGATASPFTVTAQTGDPLNGQASGSVSMSRARGSVWVWSDGAQWSCAQGLAASGLEVTSAFALTLDPGQWPAFSAARSKTTVSPAGVQWQGTTSGTTSLALVSSNLVVSTSTGGNTWVGEIPGLHNGATLTNLSVTFSAGTAWTTVPTAFPVLTVYSAANTSVAGASLGAFTYQSEVLATWNNGFVKTLAFTTLTSLVTSQNGYFFTFQGPTGGAGTTTCNALSVTATYQYSSMATSW